MKKAPDYPGYKAPCNGCGVCCLTAPCPISAQFGLWEKGKGCRALKNRAGRYWCEVIVNPKHVSFLLSKIPYSERLSAIGVRGICDHNAAENIEDAIASLDKESVFGKNVYPRSAVVYKDGRRYCVVKMDADAEPEIEDITHYY